MLGSVGEDHWALHLSDVMVGSTRVDITSGVNDTSGQQGVARLDSGSTMSRLPEAHLQRLFEAACREWPRCAQNYTDLEKAKQAAKSAAEETYGFSPWSPEGPSRAVVFQLLVQDCGQWLDAGPASRGLAELPSLHLRFAGAEGHPMQLTLRGEDYIFEVMAEAPNDDDSSKQRTRVCTPAFTPSLANGSALEEVWILGTPVFHAYTMTFDLKTSPPSVGMASVQEAPCGTCDAGAGFDPRGTELAAQVVGPHSPRRLKGQPRASSTSLRDSL